MTVFGYELLAVQSKWNGIKYTAFRGQQSGFGTAQFVHFPVIRKRMSAKDSRELDSFVNGRKQKHI